MIVIKYFETLVTSDRSNTVYEQIVNPNKKGARISKEKAYELINELGLVVTFNNQYGKVWDTPNKSFYNKYKNE